jgi:hypothetical protein
MSAIRKLRILRSPLFCDAISFTLSWNCQGKSALMDKIHLFFRNGTWYARQGDGETFFWVSISRAPHYWCPLSRRSGDTAWNSWRAKWARDPWLA